MGNLKNSFIGAQGSFLYFQDLFEFVKIAKTILNALKTVLRQQKECFPKAKRKFVQ